jgi:hypothetical protein
MSCALKVIRERESFWTTNMPSAGWINSAEKLKRTELLAARNEGRRPSRSRRLAVCVRLASAAGRSRCQDGAWEGAKMKRNKAEDRLRKLRWRAGAMGYEIVETKTGHRLVIIAPNVKLPDPSDLGETDLDAIEQWLNGITLK